MSYLLEVLVTLYWLLVCLYVSLHFYYIHFCFEFKTNEISNSHKFEHLDEILHGSYIENVCHCLYVVRGDLNDEELDNRISILVCNVWSNMLVLVHGLLVLIGRMLRSIV